MTKKHTYDVTFTVRVEVEESDTSDVAAVYKAERVIKADGYCEVVVERVEVVERVDMGGLTP